MEQICHRHNLKDGPFFYPADICETAAMTPTVAEPRLHCSSETTKPNWGHFEALLHLHEPCCSYEKEPAVEMDDEASKKNILECLYITFEQFCPRKVVAIGDQLHRVSGDYTVFHHPLHFFGDINFRFLDRASEHYR